MSNNQSLVSACCVPRSGLFQGHLVAEHRCVPCSWPPSIWLCAWHVVGTHIQHMRAE